MISRNIDSEKAPEKEFFYSVLNLNKGASQAEINERHRALSLIFHPDKQYGEASKATATRKFLEIQKAYQVLSDTFLREVYDTLGEEGLAIRWPPEVRSKSREEIQELLAQFQWENQYKKLNNPVLPKGRLSCGINACSLFGPYAGSADDTLPRRISHRFQDVRLFSFELRHSVQKKLAAMTTFVFEPRIHCYGGKADCTLLGTLRHQFSPRFTSEVMVSILRPNILTLSGTYCENGNTIAMQIACAPALLSHLPPSLTLSISQKLFRRRLEQASLKLRIGRQPHVSLNFLFPTIFGLKSLESPPPGNEIPPSSSGLSIGTTHKSFGLTFESIVPRLVGEWGVTFSELALQLKLAVECGLTGIEYICSGSWSNDIAQISASTHLNPGGVIVQLDVTHMEQRISFPLVISLEHNVLLAFWTVIVPSSALLLGYQFVIKPSRRRKRLAFIRAARKALEEDSSLRRETLAVKELLNDTARRSKQAETSIQGLVIVEASYGSVEKNDGAKDLVLDVTIPLQALVRNSQLYVPADQTKLGIQGFCDPAPFARKELHVRYIFHGRMHYAEIIDESPVVLPLAEHLVE